jgi:hypothetical protein
MRRKKLWITLAVLLVIVIALSVKAYLFFNAKPNIKINYVTEWNKISKPANYDPCQNAYFDYEKAAQYTQDMPGTIRDYMRNGYWPDWPGDMNDGQLKILKDWIDQNAQAIEHFEEGSKKPYIWSEIKGAASSGGIPSFGSPSPNLAPMQTCASAICWRAKLKASEKNYTESVDDILTCYRTGLQLGSRNRTGAENIVGMALRALAIGAAQSVITNSQVDINSLADLQKHLEDCALTSEHKVDLTQAKFFLYDAFQRGFSEDGRGNGHLIPKEAIKTLNLFTSNNIFQSLQQKPKRSFVEFLYNVFSGQQNADEKAPNLNHLAVFGPDRKQYEAKVEQIYQIYDTLQTQTLWQIRQSGFNSTKQIRELFKEYPIIAISLMPLESVFNLNWRGRLQESALITLCAILRYQAQYGRPPENLQELIDKGLLKQMPQDPFGNGPLVYKRNGNNFTLYSLGLNFTDDGGKIVRDRSGIITLWENQGDAVFWPRPK